MFFICCWQGYQFTCPLLSHERNHNEFFMQYCFLYHILRFYYFVGILLGMQFQGNLQLSFLTLIVESSISWIQSTTESTENGVQGIKMKKKECGIRHCASFVSLQEQTYMFMYKNQVLFGIYKCHSTFYWPMHNIWRIYTCMKYM